MGQYLDDDVERTYDVVIPETACIIDVSDDTAISAFRTHTGVVLPEQDQWWDETRCTACTPSCAYELACDYNGHGMCVCTLYIVQISLSLFLSLSLSYHSFIKKN